MPKRQLYTLWIKFVHGQKYTTTQTFYPMVGKSSSPLVSPLISESGCDNQGYHYGFQSTVDNGFPIDNEPISLPLSPQLSPP